MFEPKIKLAQYLFKNGRFKQHVSKDFKRFKPLEDLNVTLKLSGKTLKPYHDTQTDQLAFGLTNQKQDKLYLVLFSPLDYHFDEDAAFEWFDVHHYCFKDKDE